MDFEALHQEFVRETAPLVDRAEATLLAVERALDDGSTAAPLWGELLLALHTVKGNCGMMAHTQAEALAHAMEDRAKSARTSDDAAQADAARVLLTATDALRLGVTAMDRCEAAVNAALRRLAGEEPDLDDAVQASMSEPASAQYVAERVTDVRISADKLDRMMELVGELSINHSRVVAVVKSLFERVASSDAEATASADIIDQLGKTIASFRAQVTEARLLPISCVLGRFNRAVRDLCVTTGKRASLHVDGADTVVDKMIVDVIGEPLMHILRNAIDHGIERPEVRVAASKPAEGRIDLMVLPLTSELLIVLKDDGAGNSRQRLVAKAKERGVSTDGLSDAEILELIFLPELSTPERVTELSGRGGGMDAARRAIERIGGSIQVTSRAGAGTEMRVRVPLNVTIQKSLVVRCRDELFAIALSGVVASVRVERSQLHTVDRRSYLRFRGQTIPVHDLAVILGVPGARTSGTSLALIVEDGERLYALLVDSVGETQEIVLKEIDPALGRPAGIAGAAVLADGRVVMVIDARALGAAQRAMPAQAPRAFERTERV
jgi:two-component system chemotaxis sensor kinase CheA